MHGAHVVNSFQALITATYPPGVNAIVWPRQLPGDYAEIANALPADEGIIPLEDHDLLRLTLSESGRIAREHLLADQSLLRSADLTPVLDIIHPHQRPTAEGAIPTDVHSYHVDSATAPADTYLCTYTGACSEALPPGQAIPRIEIPETRAALLAEYGGPDDQDFQDYLADHYYTLHYLPAPHARPFPLGHHHLWRISIAYPDSPVPPCIHRAPLTLPSMPRRLLLLS